LKRESKVLEIVRREAIGAGSSSLPKLFSNLFREDCKVKECFTVPLFCVTLETNYAFSFGSEPASAPCVWLMGIKEWAWEAGFTAVSSRRDLDIPAMREG
jgi:hypothetical protein